MDLWILLGLLWFPKCPLCLAISNCATTTLDWFLLFHNDIWICCKQRPFVSHVASNSAHHEMVTHHTQTRRWWHNINVRKSYKCTTHVTAWAGLGTKNSWSVTMSFEDFGPSELPCFTKRIRSAATWSLGFCSFCKWNTITLWWAKTEATFARGSSELHWPCQVHQTNKCWGFNLLFNFMLSLDHFGCNCSKVWIKAANATRTTQEGKEGRKGIVNKQHQKTLNKCWLSQLSLGASDGLQLSGWLADAFPLLAMAAS